MTRDDFEKLVSAAVDALPISFLERLKNVAIVVEAEALPEQKVKTGVGPGSELLGLYEGTPGTVYGSHYFKILPDKITIYQGPIERAASGDPERIRAIVDEVVWHEVGHYFGISEKRIRELERKRETRRKTRSQQ
ncbi:metallopeptidase family protein [Candidatus Parcubacteria bacterium]|nr:metallopeptidase family protein [Candidatus Parcubacteria bacterium]